MERKIVLLSYVTMFCCRIQYLRERWPIRQRKKCFSSKLIFEVGKVILPFIYYRDNGTERIQSYTFDFFNYAGIHRSVMVFTTPKIAIQDIDINTDVVDETGEKLIKFIV